MPRASRRCCPCLLVCCAACGCGRRRDDDLKVIVKQGKTHYGGAALPPAKGDLARAAVVGINFDGSSSASGNSMRTIPKLKGPHNPLSYDPLVGEASVVSGGGGVEQFSLINPLAQKQHGAAAAVSLAAKRASIVAPVSAARAKATGLPAAQQQQMSAAASAMPASGARQSLAPAVDSAGSASAKRASSTVVGSSSLEDDDFDLDGAGDALVAVGSAGAAGGVSAAKSAAPQKKAFHLEAPRASGGAAVVTALGAGGRRTTGVSQAAAAGALQHSGSTDDDFDLDGSAAKQTLSAALLQDPIAQRAKATSDFEADDDDDVSTTTARSARAIQPRKSLVGPFALGGMLSVPSRGRMSNSRTLFDSVRPPSDDLDLDDLEASPEEEKRMMDSLASIQTAMAANASGNASATPATPVDQEEDISHEDL